MEQAIADLKAEGKVPSEGVSLYPKRRRRRGYDSEEEDKEGEGVVIAIKTQHHEFSQINYTILSTVRSATTRSKALRLRSIAGARGEDGGITKNR